MDIFKLSRVLNVFQQDIVEKRENMNKKKKYMGGGIKRSGEESKSGQLYTLLFLSYIIRMH